jgi:hypothetical protein
MPQFKVVADHAIDNRTTVHVEVDSNDGNVPVSQLDHRIALAVKAALDALASARAEAAEQPAPTIDVEGLHPDDAAKVRHFGYDHLPPHLAAVSRLFHHLAATMIDLLPDGSVELSEMINHLLAAKDWAVRGAHAATEDAAEPGDDSDSSDCAECAEPVDPLARFGFTVTPAPGGPSNVLLFRSTAR